ncbi:helix-turn-helix domain-containing protein [Nocardia ignorata]|uniref:helix-turn-helix domain-containing protein n=1 Tax=Nocardia ignorata TaxID=145285 RepID=UPI00362E604D
MQILEVYLATNMQRARTARRIFIHTDTVDYRLERITQMTGFDLNDITGLCYLRAALLIRAHRSTKTAEVPEDPGTRAS